MAEPGMGRVESLVEALEAHPDPAVREQVGALIGALMEFHREAIVKILEKAPADSLKDEPLIESLLLLHGLHPQDAESRVRLALEQVRPALRKHHGDVELLGIERGTARLRLIGTCNGCPSSRTTFKGLIESAICEKAPEIEAIHVEGMTGS